MSTNKETDQLKEAKAKTRQTVKVGYGATGKWLEPYIGWEFPLVRTTKNKVCFLMDCGAKGMVQNWAYKNWFENFENETEETTPETAQENCTCERPDDNCCDYCDRMQTEQILTDAKTIASVKEVETVEKAAIQILNDIFEPDERYGLQLSITLNPDLDRFKLAMSRMTEWQKSQSNTELQSLKEWVENRKNEFLQAKVKFENAVTEFGTESEFNKWVQIPDYKISILNEIEEILAKYT